MRCIRFSFVLLVFLVLVHDNFGQSRKYAMKRVNVLKAPDRQAALAELIEDTKRDFKPSEYEYFKSFQWAGQSLFQENSVQALKYLDEARILFKSNHQTYTDLFEKEFGSQFLQVLSTMRSIHLVMGSEAAFLPILESEQAFVNTLPAKTSMEFQLMLADSYARLNKLEKAESSLAAARSILDSKVRLTSDYGATDKASIKAYETYENVTRQNAEMQYNTTKASILAKRGNTTEADSIRQRVASDSENLRTSVLSERVQRKVERKSKKNYTLYEDFYGVPLDSIVKQLSSQTFAVKFGVQPMPAVEPAGYFDKIRYYIRKKDLAKSQQLITEARAKLKEYEQKPADRYTTALYSQQLDNLEAIHYLSQGSYGRLVATRSEPLTNLDATLNDALPYLSDKELQSFFDKYQGSLNQYLAALSLTGEPADAITLFEKAATTRGLLLAVSKERGRIAREQLKNQATQEVTQVRNYRERANFFAQQAQLSGVETDLDSLQFYENKILQLQRELNNRLGIAINLGKTVTWKDIQNRLKADECFVFVQQLNREYFDPKYYEGIRITPEYWMIFFDNRSPNPNLVKIGDTADFERGFRYYQNAIKTLTEDKVSYDLFWKPIAGATSNYKRVYFSADGFYHLLNPYTLLNARTQQYVLDETEVVRWSQLTAAPNPVSKSATLPTRLAFVGNPDFSMNRKTETSRKTSKPEVDFSIADTRTRSGLVQLPGAEQEVLEISQRANKLGLDVMVLTGTQATESNIKKILNPEVLHLATHGVFESGSSYDAFLRSKLVLAGVNDGNMFTADDHAKFEDGWLTAFEVTQLNLEQTRLVVLSACQTAVGDLRASDGVYGLQRAFEVAGAGYVLGSLWPINDQATAEFMTEFYTSYLGSRNTFESYRTAMLATRKKFPHPNYWGSFILNGMD
jgi:CHAT domain-containing protein